LELLGVRRLAHDPANACSAAEIGTPACQIYFFGVGPTQDWFYRRQGAWEDRIAATRQLLEVGIRPRWQLFLTCRLLPELGTLLDLARELSVWHPGANDPGLFAHLPTPDGEAQHIESLRPEVVELTGLSEALLDDSRRWLGRTRLWDSEAHWHSQLLVATPESEPGYPVPDPLALYLLPGGDMYSNMGTLEPWWRLGNLMTEGFAQVLERYCQARTLGMRLALSEDRARLAAQYGDPAGNRAYGSAGELLSRYMGRMCAAAFDSEHPWGEQR
jgi:hypothetical protein